jgi:hypothetical protein
VARRKKNEGKERKDLTNVVIAEKKKEGEGEKEFCPHPIVATFLHPPSTTTTITIKTWGWSWGW